MLLKYEIIGMVQEKHYFKEVLEKYGKHIEYSVRQCERRNGKSCAKVVAILKENRIKI